MTAVTSKFKKSVDLICRWLKFRSLGYRCQFERNSKKGSIYSYNDFSFIQIIAIRKVDTLRF